MLYIVSTPIGNLQDITLRALDILSKVDYILCEDTKKSSILLNHFKIKKKLFSYHKFSEKKELSKIIKDLEYGKDIALISDGGTPLFSDPGQMLVNACREKGIKYTAIPGANSFINALVLSGLDINRVQFLGFLPKKEKDKFSSIKQTLFYPGLSVFFDSPKRIINTLKIIESIDSQKKVHIIREMTKTFEEVLSANSSILLKHFETNLAKGEMVLILEGNEVDFRDFELKELLNILIVDFHMSKMQAIKAAAKLRNDPKKSIYDFFHRNIEKD